METPVFSSIVALLTAANVPFFTLDHEATHTSEESARARGVDIRLGVKAILLKAGESFVLMCFSAARKLSTPKLRTVLQTRDIRFATKEELLEKTGLVPGSVPPLTGKLFSFQTFFDESVTQLDDAWFNCGMLTRSMRLKASDLVRIAEATVSDFTEAAGD